MDRYNAALEVEKLNIQCVNRLADLLRIPGERLLRLSCSLTELATRTGKVCLS